MRKLDRLGWAAARRFTSYGVRLGLRVTDASVLSRAQGRLPAGAQVTAPGIVDRLYSIVIGGRGSRPGVRRFHVVWADERPLARTLDLNAALDALETDVERFVAEAARGYAFVHAGVVAWDDRAVVIPGSSHSGKTTLVAALVRAGAS